MLPTSEGIPGLIIELSKTAEASGVSVTSIARGTTTAGQPVWHPDAHAAGQRPLLRRRGLPLPPRGVRGLPQRELPRDGTPAAGDAAHPAGGDDDREQRRIAAAGGHDRPQCVSVGRGGADRAGRGRLRRLEVCNEPESTPAHLHRHRAHRRRGAGARGRAGQQQRGHLRRRRLGRHDGGLRALLRRRGHDGARRGRSGQGAAAARQVHEQGPVHPVPDAGGQLHLDGEPQSVELGRAHGPVGEDQGRRDVLQRGAGRPGARRLRGGVQGDERHLRRRHLRGHRRRARERRHDASPSTWARPSA